MSDTQERRPGTSWAANSGTSSTTAILPVTGRMRLVLSTDFDTSELQLRELAQVAPAMAEVVLQVAAKALIPLSLELLASRVDLASITVESDDAETIQKWCRTLRNGGRYDW